jgi:nucleotide-binding universal stress UspA family protein
MPTSPILPVVVGVDGSDAALAALDLAAEEAAARVTPLIVVYAHDAPDYADRRLLASAAARARAEHPMLSVGGVLATGDPADALIHHASPACLLVLGHRGRRAAPHRTGSVTARALRRATVPVLIHRPFDTPVPSPTRPVVVGLADPAGSDPFLGLAFEEAALRGAPQLAMHVWPPVNGGDTNAFGHARPEAEAQLAEAVAVWADKYPEVAVRRLLRHGVDVVIAIAAASHSAQLTVVGASRRTRRTGRPSGSVGEALAHRAGCPLAVVPLVG